MNSGHGRAPSGARAPTLDEGEPWEKMVVLGLMKVCLRDSTGQSSIDALRDALIDSWPHVLPEMKHRYGKFTSFLKTYDRYFQINPYDRTVRLISLHPDLSTPSSSRSDRSSYNSMSDTSSIGSHGYSSLSSASLASDVSRATSSASVNVPSSSSTGSRVRSGYHTPQPTSAIPDMIGSPRGHSAMHRSTAHAPSNFGNFSTQPSSHHPSMSQSSASANASSSAPAKPVSFSSLEQWEQMIIFAVLKYLLQTPSGLEHYTILQERLNDTQLAAKYVTILDLLRLFPGNFAIDSDRKSVV